MGGFNQSESSSSEGFRSKMFFAYDSEFAPASVDSNKISDTFIMAQIWECNSETDFPLDVDNLPENVDRLLAVVRDRLETLTFYGTYKDIVRQAIKNALMSDKVRDLFAPIE